MFLGIFLMMINAQADSGVPRDQPVKILANGQLNSSEWHTRYTDRNIYLWNKAHTVKRLNLKNYPNTSWGTPSTSYITYYRGKAYIYANGTTPAGHSFIGWAWIGGFLTGYNNNYRVGNDGGGDFVSDQDYQNYVNESPSQWLTRNILKLFPNCKLSWDLSEDVEDGVNSLDDISDGYADNDNTAFSDFKPIDGEFVKYFYINETPNVTMQQRLTKITAGLDRIGYNSSKRLSLRGYEIGIYFHGVELDDDTTEFGIIIAKPKKLSKIS